MKRSILLAVLLEAALSAPALDGVTAYSMKTHDGRRLVGAREGTNTALRLVRDEGLPPCRPWKIYVVKATHTDIGLHNSQYVQRHGTVKRIGDAMRLVKADKRSDDDPAAYRYVMEGTWFWENYPMDRGEAAAWNVVSNYVRRGRLDIACGCAGNHTHVMGPEELARLALTKRRLQDKWGVGTKTLLMADNPGMSWSVVKPFAAAGIENVLFAPNQWNPNESTLRKMDRSVPGATWNPDAGGGGSYIDVGYESGRPMVFKWESPDRSTNLLVWCSTEYAFGLDRAGVHCHGGNVEDVEKKMPAFLANLERRYPYDVWLACEYGDDEEANAGFADFAAEWNAKWACPQFVTVGRLDEPFDELRRRFGDKIPVVRGEMTSGWLQHVASTPELLAEKLEAERRLAAAEKAWRACPDRDESLKAEIDRAWWYLILNDEHSYGVSGYQGRRVFETWMQHRDWIARARETADKVARSVGLAEPAEPMRDEVKGEAENAWYRVRVNGRGEIESVFDKELGRELLDGPANRLLYTRDNHRTWSDESLLGAKIVRRVFLARDEKRIDVEDRFEHATDLFNTRRYLRYGYVAFPFAVPNGAFKATLGGGEVIDPYRDQSGYATDAYVAVREWCAVENEAFGVALRQRDTALTEFGEIHPDKTCFAGAPPDGKSAIYSYAFADWLQLHVPDGELISFTLRYSITSYRAGEGKWRRAPEGVPSLTAADFPEPHGDGWTGLVEKPCAGHGEKDGQLYLLWGADLSPTFDRYELWRDDGFLACVSNEAPHGIPYRVARYVDLDAGSHTTRTYCVRKVWKDGTKGDFSAAFAGRTRAVSDVEAIESEGLRCEMNRNGAYVTSWRPLGGEETLFRPKRANWGKEETHGGIPICWPWFGKPPREGLPKHGLVRYAKWRLEEKIGKNGLRWSLASTPETRALWPHDFRLDYQVTAAGRKLRCRLVATNTGTAPFEAAGGFHPYFKVADSRQVSLDGQPITQETYRVSVPAAGRPRALRDLATGRELRLSARGNADWFAWNPGRAMTPLCGTLGDDEWRGFFCVEPCSLKPTTVGPGESQTFEMEISWADGTEAEEPPMSWEEFIASSASNIDLVKSPIRGILVEHHGCCCGQCRREENRQVTRHTRGFMRKGWLIIHPRTGSNWMNDGAVWLTDRLVGAALAHYGLGKDVPIISLGKSMGGGGALAWPVFSKYRANVRAVFANCPASDFPTQYRYLCQKELWERRGKAEWASLVLSTLLAAYPKAGPLPYEKQIEARSPLHLVARMPDVPYVVNQATEDWAVLKATQADVLVPAMRQAGLKVKYYVSEGVGHCQFSPVIGKKWKAAVVARMKAIEAEEAEGGKEVPQR